MWHDASELDRVRDRGERHFPIRALDHEDEPDAHVPCVEALRLGDAAELREEREDPRGRPRSAVDGRREAIRKSTRKIPFPAAAGDVGDRVDARRVAQQAEVLEV